MATVRIYSYRKPAIILSICNFAGLGFENSPSSDDCDILSSRIVDIQKLSLFMHPMSEGIGQMSAESLAAVHQSSAYFLLHNTHPLAVPSQWPCDFVYGTPPQYFY
jgi:hypothetical protein